MIPTVIITTIVLSIVLHHITIYFKRAKYKHIPSPAIPISWKWCFGHTFLFKKVAEENHWNLSETFEAMKRRSGKAAEKSVIFLGFTNRAILYTTEINIYSKFLSDHRVFQKQKPAESLLDYVNGRRILGNKNLLLEPGTDIWYQKRRILDPAFQKRFLRQLHAPMNKSADKLNEYLKNSESRGKLEIHGAIMRTALEVVCTCGFNLNEDFLTKGDSPINAAIDNMLVVMQLYLFNVFNFWAPWKFIEEKKLLKSSVDFLRSFVGDHLRERFEGISRESTDDNEDMLTHIIRANISTSLSMEDVIDDFCVFLVAGMETTANVLSCLLWECLKNKDITHKITQELDRVHGDQTQLQYDDLCQLTYLEQCIKECLRLHGPASGTFRVSPSSPITVDNLFIPPNTRIFVNIQQAHLSNTNWDNPKKFDPDRFGSDCKVKPFTFLPFSAGPRVCIGKQFSMLEMKIILAKLFRKFEFFDPFPEETHLDKESALTIRPKHGVFVGIIERSN